jgi:predicted Ser/Thr protein kinase
MKLGFHSMLDDGSRAFGGYELRRRIGRGGMGVVYEAEQTHLNRKVALKMIYAGRAAPDSLRERFQTEAEVLARLDHPNIVPIYDFGDQEDQPYFTMKLVEGQSLEAQLEESPELPSGRKQTREAGREAAQLIRTVARAVQHAHQHGVIHRDLKPSNILVDSHGQPHLTDFGLAKILQEGNDLTRSIELVGTPGYMAPEQCDPERKQVTAAVDIYSFGAVLYALLVRRPPFHGGTPWQMVGRLLYEEPIRPRTVHPAIALDLETISLKCLEKNPEDRYDSAEALADDLDRFLEDRPIAARPVSVVERLWRRVRRRPASVQYGLALGLLAVVSLGLYAGRHLWLRLSAPKPVQPPVEVSIVYPGNPQAGGDASSVNVVQGRAYVTDNRLGLKLFDVNSPEKPELLYSHKTDGFVWGAEVADEYAYVADGPKGLKVFQVSDPSQVQLVGQVMLSSEPKDSIIINIQTVGALGFATGGSDPAPNGLLVFDLNNPTQPELISRLDTPGNAWSVQVQDGLAYVADGQTGLAVIDVQDAKHPVLRGTSQTGGMAKDLCLVGNYAYVADAWSGLEVLDVTDPSQPARVGVCPSPGTAYEVDVAGSYAFIAAREGGIQVIDIRNPKEPVHIGAFNLSGPAWGLDIVDDLIYVAAGSQDLVILKISENSP